MKTVGVLGLGNVLMGDDGIGPRVVCLLEGHPEIPPEVTLLDLGTPGPELARYLADFDAVVVVDAVTGNGSFAQPVGTLARFQREAILAQRDGPRLSPHHPALATAVTGAELARGGELDLILLGIITGPPEVGTSLTPEVEKALPGLLEAVREEVVRL